MSGELFVLFGLGFLCLPVYLARRGRNNLPKFAMIVAATSQNRGIGFQGTLPWKIPGKYIFI
jgi:hypothetical protein